MTEITKKDFETVEKEYSITVCDVCKKELDESITLAVNPKVSVSESAKLVETYDNMEMAERAVQRVHAMKKEAMRYGVALGRDAYNPRADMQLDICKNCFQEVFETDADTTSGELKFDSDGLRVEQVTNPLIEWSRVENVLIAWFIFNVAWTVAIVTGVI